MILELHAIFSGHVQGVGFRYNTRSIAATYPIAGWVRNLPNGTVEMLAQGEKLVLERFLNEILRYFTDNIREKEINYRKQGNKLNSFQIA